MKKTLIVGFLFLCCIAPYVALSAGPSLQSYKNDSLGFQRDKREIALDKAVENVHKNKLFIATLRSEFGESRLLEWGVPVADQLPAQPIAVIQLMAMLDIPVRDMCPRIVIEDAIPFEAYVQWMEEAVDSLGAFTMTNPNEELIRQQCLSAIQKSLGTKDSWKY